MIVQPRIRGFICTTAHPLGCAKNVQEQIEYMKEQKKILDGPQNVLIIGSSTGYGLSSRIVAAYGSGASTMGVYFEKMAENNRTATAGWYNSTAFENFARRDGLYVKSFNGDAFSNEMKEQVLEAIKKDWGQVDLIVYSVAAPRRVDPKTGQVCKSVLKPCKESYTNKSIDFDKDEIISVTLPVATDEEVRQTVAVMGGEDWELWIDILEKADLLASGVIAVAYSYVGPDVTIPVYRNGTIGAAKDHLEATAKKLDQRLQKHNGHAFISVNKALVTQSSSAIPFIPLYFTILMKVMKEKNIHEECIQQIYRLFKTRLYGLGKISTDDHGRIRIDDLEMRKDVQAEVQALWEIVSNENLHEVTDLPGYHRDFLKMFGFGIGGIDYNADVEI